MFTSPQRVRRVGVFCGSRPGTRAGYQQLAWKFGTLMAERGAGLVYGAGGVGVMGERGAGLVYGAGGVGVMGALSQAVRAAGGSTTGVIPQELFDREQPDSTNQELFVVKTMHERKALMYRLSGGFAVLPGGFGTLDELMEVSTWNQLGIIEKPIVLVNEGGFFDPLVALLDNVVAEGFLTSVERGLVNLCDTAEEALDLLGYPRIPLVAEQPAPLLASA